MNKYIKNIKSKSNGFTLIELLAVILILGIIALIAIPTVNNLLEESRRGAFNSTLNNIEKKVEETCTLEQIKNAEINTHYTITNGVSNPPLDLKGDLPDGDIYVDAECNVTYTLANHNFVGTKDEPEGEVIISKNDGSQNNQTLIEKSTDKEKSYVGYYADVDGNGTVDGIIFADLITGNTGDGQWYDDDGNYTVPTISPSSAKDYYIGNGYEGKFGTKPVLSLAKNSTGEDRFYVLSLNDISSSRYCWYYSAYGNMSDYSTYTSTSFGSGLENTTKMITKWNASGYGTQNGNSSYKDLWGVINDYVAKGWFVPSAYEWSTFGGEIAEKSGITSSNYTNYGLSDWYWSSSQNGTNYAWGTNFSNGYMNFGTVNSYGFVRLATTF